MATHILGAPTAEIKDIPGWPGYRADSDGHVWSDRSGRWKRLDPNPTQAGRLMVSVWEPSGKRRFVSVHRLVALAFHGEPPDGTEVCHNDGNPLNNRPENLRYDTRKGNMADTLKHGTRNRGSRNGRAKCSPDVIQEVRRRLTDGETQRSIAEAVGLSQAMVSHINTGKNWWFLD